MAKSKLGGSVKIDWYYHRKGCRTCQRADGFLEKKQATVRVQVDARKTRIGPKEAIRLAREADQLWVARGKSFVHFDVEAAAPADAELKKLLIGPSGNLRAPTIRMGRNMLVGFHPDAYIEGVEC
ncbi:MAG: hypothetical protein K8T25_12920 [Planctomycetia bacterium]|nr:hypothetical protein [Planctomycetia bacterium]